MKCLTKPKKGGEKREERTHTHTHRSRAGNMINDDQTEGWVQSYVFLLGGIYNEVE